VPIPSYLRYPVLVILWVVALMSGVLSIVREVYTMYSGQLPAKPLFWSCIRLAFMLSAAILWFLEHKGRLEADARADLGKPQFALEVLDVDLHVYTRSDFFFWITNCGKRSARHVTFDPIRSRTAHHAIRFDTQPTLAPDRRLPLTFRCGGDDNWIMDGNVGRLLLFFEDNPKRESTLRYDITVRFLDGDTALEEHHILQAELASGGAGARLKICPALAVAGLTSPGTAHE
jgi:hypothetical protein